jgi:hypothetical protein
VRSATLALLLVTGCVQQETTNAFVPEVEAAVAPSPPTTVRDVEVATKGPIGDPAAEPSTAGASPRDRPPPEPIFFSLGAGHGALGRVDLGPCRDQGLPSGYLHMRVTFRHSGRVVRAAVESPTEPPSEALACIGAQLEMAMVPVFDGDDVTLSKGFFVN